jgi:predicted pyridoxine 5'-phosphate oxidase superfamily flavin-nucleotide-binding protein
MSRFRNFHEGEAKIQADEGIDTRAFDRAVDQPFQPELNESEVRFVAARTFSVAASLDDAGRPWASPLIGAAGELFTVEDLTTVRVRPRMIDGDPLFDNLTSNGSMGVLYFNPAIRRRAKSLGAGEVMADGSITYRMHRMFGLCPKYIYKRQHEVDQSTPQKPFEPAVSKTLNDEDVAQLQNADTLFLGSHSDAYGADPTHRGGPAGFVTVENGSTLWMPDYIGNGMFQTLGNLQLDDRIGVLSIDFSSGRILQVTGRGSLHQAQPTGVKTKRALRIDVEEVRVSMAEIGSWTDLEPYDIPA